LLAFKLFRSKSENNREKHIIYECERTALFVKSTDSDASLPPRLMKNSLKMVKRLFGESAAEDVIYMH
jgi:hypothetical protein